MGIVAVSAVVIAAAAMATGSAASGPALPPQVQLATAATASDTRSFELVDSTPRAPLTLKSPKAQPAPSPVPAPAALVTTPLAAVGVTIGALGIPDLVLTAYKSAETSLAGTMPGCHLPWSLLAGIGRIESGHAGGGRTDVNGTTTTAVLGPVLDGRGAGDAVITDTDAGKYDGDATHDRAVGPMQFIPGTWAKYGADGNGDGTADPNNVFDASLAAGKYLCSGGLDLADPAQATTAVLRYNNSGAYAANVLGWASAYASGASSVPGEIGSPAPIPTPAPTDSLAVEAAAVATAADAAPDQPSAPPAFGIPGLPPLPVLPCLVFCPPVAAP
ncbi:lytic transglycosylase domain-containing protein [Rhodococcoides trifolii]|uniref:lytic transglycosylase domain-containing protein n=1 Tax=Rhodococcoides trifolii TaxID=908250 RepID=UPI001E33698A|nr:lytic murein transglycosylase [Rhodococcus trifolii]